jgi:hypothetical protein
VAEWLRRLTRNQFPSGSVGSNPTDCVNILIQLSPKAAIGGLMQLPHLIQHRWFSGRMLACHAGGPGSIPGRCNSLFCWYCFYSLLLPQPSTGGLWVQPCRRGRKGSNITEKEEEKVLETRGIDPRTSHMLSERSTI